MHLATQNAHLLNIFQTVANESKVSADQKLLENWVESILEQWKPLN
jgi:hypothetical protein